MRQDIIVKRRWIAVEPDFQEVNIRVVAGEGIER